MVAQDIKRNTIPQSCMCCNTSCHCGDCAKCTPKKADIIPAPKPSERRHDIQYIRCKCGLSYPSYKEWIDHFLYRYMLLNAQKFPINPTTLQEQHIPIDASYLLKEITEQVLQLIREHSGEHSNDI